MLVLLYQLHQHYQFVEQITPINCESTSTVPSNVISPVAVSLASLLINEEACKLSTVSAFEPVDVKNPLSLLSNEIFKHLHFNSSIENNVFISRCTTISYNIIRICTIINLSINQSTLTKFVSDEISTEVKNPLSLLKSLNVISDISFLLSAPLSNKINSSLSYQ